MSVSLTQAVIEIERHAAAAGWDQSPRLFALVDTAELLKREPQLAASLGDGVVGEPGGPAALTPIEQEELGDDALDDLLARIVWPDDVIGCAVVVERLMLPPSAESAIADLDSGDATAKVTEHPDREEVRIAVGILRNGDRECAIRLRSHDDDRSVVSGADLVPGLTEALAATFEL